MICIRLKDHPHGSCCMFRMYFSNEKCGAHNNSSETTKTTVNVMCHTNIIETRHQANPDKLKFVMTFTVRFPKQSMRDACNEVGIGVIPNGEFVTGVEKARKLWHVRRSIPPDREILPA
eukprot:2919215-Amphidinium_carterae.1